MAKSEKRKEETVLLYLALINRAGTMYRRILTEASVYYMAKTRAIQFISCNWVVLTDILLAKGDEPNLILPKFARPLYFFSHQLSGTYRIKYCYMKTVNDFAF